MKRLLTALMFSCIPLSWVQAGDIITMNISPSGYPPYMIKAEQGPAKGIMVEVLNYIADKHGYQLQTVGIPKKRVAMTLLAGSIDATATAREWIAQPDQYVFSDVIVVVKDVLFSPKKRPVKFEKVDDLLGKTLGTHLGYNYPMLDEYFADRRINKTEANTELAMLQMTLRKRNDATIVTDLVGQWIIKNNPAMQDKFVISSKTLNSFDYRLMFNKKWQSFVQVFNRELGAMRVNGELDRILDQYY